MDNLSCWLALAFGQFIGFALIRPLFNGKWREGIVQGLIVVCLTTMIGYGYVAYREKHRVKEFINDAIEFIDQQEIQTQTSPLPLSPKKELLEPQR